MKKWKLIYEQVHSFEAPVTNHFYSIRCLPRTMPSQRVEKCVYEIFPENPVMKGRDSFGNEMLNGRIAGPDKCFSVKMSSIVITENVHNPEKKQYHQLGMYRCESKLTKTGKNLRAWMKELPDRQGKNDWERSKELLLLLWEKFRYLRGSTGVDTTAEEAFSQGCGVCQDYAHILLTLCRAEGMTARYAAGAIPGEGQTHAWIEVWQDGEWKGFDPTNRKEVDEEYISFAYGRDASDCGINRGIFLGNARQIQNIYVRMEEI